MPASSHLAFRPAMVALAAFVVGGTALAQPTPVQMWQYDGTEGHFIAGPAPGGRFASGADGIGDFNCDGQDDFVVTSLEVGVRVFYGPWNGDHPLDSSDYSAAPGFLITDLELGNTVSNGFLGDPVHGLGDINGDGCSDFAVGLPASNGTDGSVLVVLGGTSGLGGSVPISALLGSRAMIIEAPVPEGWFGMSVHSADYDGDGHRDLIAGAFYEAGLTYPNWDGGSAYIIYGPLVQPTGNGIAATRAITQGDLVATRVAGGAASQINHHVGWSVAGVGDFDGVPGDEVVVGAYGHDFPDSSPVSDIEVSGAAFVLFSTDERPALLNVAILGPHGVTIRPETPPAWADTLAERATSMGWRSTPLSDINADGRPDFLIAARMAHNTGSEAEGRFAGRVYLIEGRPGLRDTAAGLSPGDPTLILALDDLNASGSPLRGRRVLGSTASEQLGSSAAADRATSRIILGTALGWYPHGQQYGANFRGAWILDLDACPSGDLDLSQDYALECARRYNGRYASDWTAENVAFIGDQVGGDGVSEAAFTAFGYGNGRGGLYVANGVDVQGPSLPPRDCAALPAGAVFYYRPEPALPHIDRIGGEIASSGEGEFVAGRYGGAAFDVDRNIHFTQANVDFPEDQSFTIEIVGRIPWNYRERNVISNWDGIGYRVSKGSQNTPLTLRSGATVRRMSSVQPDGDGWYSLHYVVDYGAGEMRIYNHGVERGSWSSPLDQLGSLASPADLRLHSRMTFDHVVMYDRALTPVEIEHLHDLPKCE